MWEFFVFLTFIFLCIVWGLTLGWIIVLAFYGSYQYFCLPDRSIRYIDIEYCSTCASFLEKIILLFLISALLSIVRLDFEKQRQKAREEKEAKIELISKMENDMLKAEREKFDKAVLDFQKELETFNNDIGRQKQ